MWKVFRKFQFIEFHPHFCRPLLIAALGTGRSVPLAPLATPLAACSPKTSLPLSRRPPWAPRASSVFRTFRHLSAELQYMVAIIGSVGTRWSRSESIAVALIRSRLDYMPTPSVMVYLLVILPSCNAFRTFCSRLHQPKSSTSSHLFNLNLWLSKFRLNIAEKLQTHLQHLSHRKTWISSYTLFNKYLSACQN